MATVSISIALELSGITGQLPLLLTVCGSCPVIPDNCIRLQFVTGIFSWLQFVATDYLILKELDVAHTAPFDSCQT